MNRPPNTCPELLGTATSKLPMVLLSMVAVLFLFSGAASLLYELAWIRVLALHQGSTAWALATVAATFLAGLGVGAGWAGRRAARIAHPLRLFALLELGIATFGFASIPIVEAVGHWTGLLRATTGVGEPVRVAATFLTLLPPTFLMGASLPVLIRAVEGNAPVAGRVGLLYGLNTLGAALGVLGGGLLLLPSLGLTGTVQLAACTSLGVGLAALLLGRFASPEEVPADPAARTPAPPLSPAPTLDSATRTPSGLEIVLFGTVAISGVLSLSCQVAWTRLLAPILGSSVQATTLVLGTFLLGLGLGSLLAGLPGPWHRRAGIPWVLAGIALWVCMGFLFLNELPGLFARMALACEGDLSQLFLCQVAVAASLTLIPTMGTGMLLPLAVARAHATGESAARAAGSLYVASTAGCILGSLVTAFGLLPWIGPDGVLRLAGALGFASAGALAFVLTPPRRRVDRWVRGSLAVAGMGVALALLPGLDAKTLQRGVFRSVLAKTIATATSADLVWYREGRNATVTVMRDADGTWLRINGKTDASTTGDLATQYLLAYLPLFLHPDPREVCVIGYGSGATVHAVATHPAVQRVAVAEIEPAVIDASRFFTSVNHDVLEDPRVRLTVENGRTLLKYCEDTYDLVISEPSNPWMEGVSSLFTQEFYRDVRRRLAAGGVLCQWIQCYEISRETIQGLLRTLAGEFPHVAVFCNGGDLLCLASAEPLTGDAARTERLLGNPLIARNLARLDVHDAFDLFSPLLRRYPEQPDLFRSPAFNTDDNLWLEHRAPLEMYRGLVPNLPWLGAAEYEPGIATLIPGLSSSELRLGLARSLMRRTPTFWKLIQGMAEESLEQGDAQTAQVLTELSVAARDRVVALEEADGWFAQARACMAERRFDAAIPLLERVVELRPLDAPAHRLLGWSLLRCREFPRGLQHCLRAVELQPDDYESRTRIAELAQAADMEQVPENLARALELNPAYWPAWAVHLRGLHQDGDEEAFLRGLAAARQALAPEAWTRLQSYLKNQDAPGKESLEGS